MSQLWKSVKADISKVTVPVLLFRSLQDHVVEPSNAAFILSSVSSTDIEEVHLPDSYHVATLDYDAEVIVRDSIAFVRRLSG
jgi:carboxylesterase